MQGLRRRGARLHSGAGSGLGGLDPGAGSSGRGFGPRVWLTPVDYDGRGEAAAIRLLLQADADLLLSDDGRAIRTCRIMGLPFITAPRVVVDLYRDGVIRLSRARAALEMLAVAGRYARDVRS